METNTFEKLECWQLARELCKFVNALTKKDLFAKDFKHVTQINDSAGSAMDNIAEGFGRGGNKEFQNFLSISLGSSNECKSQLIRALDKQYITEEEHTTGIDLVTRTIQTTGGLLHYLKKSDFKGHKFK